MSLLRILTCFAYAQAQVLANRWPMNSTLLAGDRSSVGIAMFWSRPQQLTPPGERLRLSTHGRKAIVNADIAGRPASRASRPHRSRLVNARPIHYHAWLHLGRSIRHFT
jgi:hypothetical protein